MKDNLPETGKSGLLGGWVDKGNGWHTPAQTPGVEEVIDPITGQSSRVYRWIRHDEQSTDRKVP